MELIEILKAVCSEKAVSGNENAFFDALSALLPKGASTQRDKIGNTYIKLGPQGAEHSVLLDAHCDQIGFVVTDICSNGFLKVAAVGGIDARTLYGERVEVFGKQTLNGVFGAIPPHLQKEGDRDKYVKTEDLAIDTGLSKDEVCALVSRGDFVCVKSDFELLSENRVCSAGLDNKAGVAVLLYVLNKLTELKNTEVTLLLSVQEELGLRGASAAEVVADAVICVDASFASYVGCPLEKTGKMAKGAMLGHSPVLSRSLTAALENIAVKNDIPLQHEILPDLTGTNADRLSLRAGGANCALISFPLLNMHSAVETLDLRDLYSIASIIEGYIKEVDRIA